MKKCLVFILFLFSQASIAMQAGSLDHMIGGILSVNHVDTDLEDGVAVNYNYALMFPSIGVEYANIDDGIANLFVGIGFSNLFQYQLGYGNEGKSRRIRSDLFLSSLFKGRKDNFSAPLMHPRREFASWYDRLSLSFSVTKYDDEAFDKQYQVGIGFVF